MGSVILASVRQLPEDWQVLFDERAAIREYDGGMTRQEAERFALVDVIEAMKARGSETNDHGRDQTSHPAYA